MSLTATVNGALAIVTVLSAAAAACVASPALDAESAHVCVASVACVSASMPELLMEHAPPITVAVRAPLPVPPVAGVIVFPYVPDVGRTSGACGKSAGVTEFDAADSAPSPKSLRACTVKT